jgi:phage terminase small subunit
MTTTMTGAEWAAAVQAEYDIPDSQLAAVELAAAALDRAQAAQESLDRDGILVQGLHGLKANPAAAIKRDAVQEHVRLCRSIGLHQQTKADESNPGGAAARDRRILAMVKGGRGA